MRYAIQLGEKCAELNFDARLTIAQLVLVKDMLQKAVDTRISELKEIEGRTLPLSADIDKMYPELSVRTRNVLKRGGKNTIEDVLNCTPTELKKLRNMGKNSLQEIQERFSKYGTFVEEGDEA